MTNEATKSWTVSVDEEGILILPDELLDKMGWGEGDDLEWIEEPDGSIILKKYEPNENSDGSTTSTIVQRDDRTSSESAEGGAEMGGQLVSTATSEPSGD
jgi:AbrB family looped-hinge helix DNA binding protein